MNRKMMTVCGAALAAALLAGCMDTPGSAIVRAKDGYRQEDAVSTAGTALQDETLSGGGNGTVGGVQTAGTVWQDAAGLRELLGAPERYVSEAEDATGNIKIHTAASVEVPDVGHVSAIPVEPHTWEADEFAFVTQALFQDARLYDACGIVEGSAREALEPLAMPFDFQEEPIDLWAPELGTVGKVYALARTADAGSYRYEWTRKDDGAVSLWVKSVDGPAAYADAAQCQWFGQDSMKALYPWVPDGEELSSAIGMTKEEAKKIADETVSRLCLTGMEEAASEPVIALMCGKCGVPQKRDMTDCGYVFHYTRKLEGIPVTYTMIPGGSTEGTKNGAFAWAYETLDVYVTEDGIDEIRFENQYDIGAAEDEPMKLLPFSDIVEIYEKMMAVLEADVLVDNSGEEGDFGEPAQARNYRIHRIALGYTRIYDPLSESKSGMLVPVWDFFGEYEERAADGTWRTVRDENKSFLTIHAVDGTIVDRWLGY